jgi:hemoglobin
LGGAENVAAIAADFGDRMRQDTPDKLGRFWLHRGTDGINRERQLAVQFFQNAARCGPIYQGRNMEKAHRGMGLSARDWDRAFNFFRLAVWA